jgi:hypothetical protein
LQFYELLREKYSSLVQEKIKEDPEKNNCSVAFAVRFFEAIE